jgi:hypothetical protein
LPSRSDFNTGEPENMKLFMISCSPALLSADHCHLAVTSIQENLRT